MKILTTGKGTSGSWQVRGVQLGGAVGKAIPKASLEECQKADIIVFVKRNTHIFFYDNMLGSGKPWVWDLVDLYPQPECSSWDRDRAIEWAKIKINGNKPYGIIYPNRKMMEDVGIPGTVIYHHCRPNAPINPIREKVRIVGYEGGLQYLGKWRGLIESECKRRGWRFRTDIPLHEMDIVVAFRDDCGYVQKSWKSNIKLANAHGTGTPFVGNSESGYDETLTGYERFIFHPKQLAWAFDELEPYETRKMISERFLKNTITLESCASQLKAYCETILRNQ